MLSDAMGSHDHDTCGYVLGSDGDSGGSYLTKYTQITTTRVLL